MRRADSNKKPIPFQLLRKQVIESEGIIQSIHKVRAIILTDNTHLDCQLACCNNG